MKNKHSIPNIQMFDVHLFQQFIFPHSTSWAGTGGKYLHLALQYLMEHISIYETLSALEAAPLGLAVVE
jgi:hypothetical protein